jgi:hypothetical protein
MGDTRQGVIESLREVKNHPRVMSFKGLKMLFRIANYFNPRCFLQIGTNYGLTASSLLNVSSTSRLWIYEPNITEYPVLSYVLVPYVERIKIYTQLGLAVDEYKQSLTHNDCPFVLVNTIPEEDDFELLQATLVEILAEECVIVLCNLNRNDKMKLLWNVLKQNMSHGQSFTNEKTAVMVVQKKFNLEHYFLWF